MLRISALAIAAVLGAAACSNNPPVRPLYNVLIPLPQTIAVAEGAEFVLGPETVIYVPAGDAEAHRIGRYLSDVIGIAAGPEPPRVEPEPSGAARGGIHLRLSGIASGVKEAEAYELSVDAAAVTITAPRHAGLFYGLQTLRQLLPAFVEY